MSMHNFVPPHLRKKPCRMCKIPTKQLVNGQIVAHPVCVHCQAKLDRQFRIASIQRARSA